MLKKNLWWWVRTNNFSREETSKECFSTRILSKRSQVVLAKMLWQRSSVLNRVSGLTKFHPDHSANWNKSICWRGLCPMSVHIFRVHNNFPMWIFVLFFFSLTQWWSKVQHKFLFPEEIIYCAFLHEVKHFLEQAYHSSACSPDSWRSVISLAKLNLQCWVPFP